MHAAAALLAALTARDATGHGQVVEVAQLEAVLQLSVAAVVDWTRSGIRPRRHGNRDPAVAPQGAYPCRGDDTWVALSVRDDDWHRFAALLGHADWADDPRWATSAGRATHHDELDRSITAWTRDRDADEVADALRRVGIPAARVVDPSRLDLEDEQLRTTGYFQRLSRRHVGELDYPTFPVRASYGPVEVHARPAPTLGEHTAEVLREALGLDDAAIAELERARITGTTVEP